MTAAPDHPDEQDPVAEHDLACVESSDATVFTPLGDQAQGDYGTLRESPTNRWRVQQR